MLQKHPQTLSNDACNDCNWNLFDAIEVKDYHSEIFLAKNRNNCFFQNQRQNLDPNSFMPRKKKLSLRRNRQIALKENIPVLTIVGQQELLNNTWAKTGLMTRADSQMIRTVNEYPPQNQFSCFSSYVFEEINPNEHQGSFGRFIEFNRSGEVMKNQKVITRSKYKSITEINLQNTPAISDRTKKQFSKQNIYKNQVLVENKRSSKSEAGGEVLQINNFFSQPHIKNYLSVANEYQKLDSSIMLNMKDIKYPKKTHLLESLKFKDTESINDEQSSLFSEVLSEQSELTNDKGQFSLVIMPKLNNRRNIVIPKQSKFK